MGGVVRGGDEDADVLRHQLGFRVAEIALKSGVALQTTAFCITTNRKAEVEMTLRANEELLKEWEWSGVDTIP